jgi:hypothetical protein
MLTAIIYNEKIWLPLAARKYEYKLLDSSRSRLGLASSSLFPIMTKACKGELPFPTPKWCNRRPHTSSNTRSCCLFSEPKNNAINLQMQIQ